jgi:hypothetical protein
MAALQKEQFVKDIEKNLYANNEFMMLGKDDSSYVTFKTVNLPQAGTGPSVEKDRASLPATVSQRTDANLTYNLSQYSTSPQLINQNDDVQYLAYDKRMDVMGDQISALGQAIANHTLYAWSSSVAAQIVRTTGATTGDLVHSTATGTRKLVTLTDLKNARKILDKQNLGNGKLTLIVPSDMYWNDLVGISELTKYLEFGRAILPTGVIGNVLGMDIMIRSSVQAYDNTGTPVRKALSANGEITTLATSDNNSILLVHDKYIRKAKGAINIYTEEKSPIYFGDIMSAEVFHGASKNRTNGEGIVNIIQTVG